MRAYEFITEAAYDGMITKMLNDNPDNTQVINDNLKWAKSALKKADRIIWYMRIVQGQLSGDNTILGDYQFKSYDQLQNDIIHFYGYQSDKIQNYQFSNQTVSQVVDDLTQFEREYQKQQVNKDPVPIQRGDYPLIEFKDGTKWWFVNRAYCEHEGRSGEHCGNAMGRTKTNQRILSLRTPQNNVILTFILEPNGFLGEMKAKYNQKPNPKYHPQIVALLLNPMIKGIEGGGSLPANNFSLFDLSDEYLTLFKEKPTFIVDQIKANPIGFTNAPIWIRNNTEYQNIAKQALPGLSILLQDDGTLTRDHDAWINAIRRNSDITIYAPKDLPDYQDLLIKSIGRNPSILQQCSRDITNDFELMKKCLKKYIGIFRFILPNNKNYIELCKIGINIDDRVLELVPMMELYNTKPEAYLEICKFSLNKRGINLRFIPDELRTPEICKIAVGNFGEALRLVPDELRTPEICKIAVSNMSSSLEYVPEKLYYTSRYDYLVVCTIAVRKNGTNLKYVPYRDTKEYLELCKIAINDRSYNLEYVPIKMLYTNSKDYLELCKIAASKNRNALDEVPEVFRDQIKKELGL